MEPTIDPEVSVSYNTMGMNDTRGCEFCMLVSGKSDNNAMVAAAPALNNAMVAAAHALNKVGMAPDRRALRSAPDQYRITRRYALFDDADLPVYGWPLYLCDACFRTIELGKDNLPLDPLSCMVTLDVLLVGRK